MRRRAFTLIELLMVVTIIAVLLALLVPAMDKAIYQAELTVCGSTLHGLGTGLLTYASGNRRSYPHRPGVAGADWQPTQLTYGDQPQWDERPALRPYISLNKSLNCPLIGELELDGAKPETHTHATHVRWYGLPSYNPTTAQREKGMLRIGDRWEWYDQGYQYKLTSRVLAGTRYVYAVPDGYMVASHPAETYDEEVIWQDLHPYGEANLAGANLGVGNSYTLGGWYSHGATGHTPIDLNNLFDDGSVKRDDQVGWEKDESMARAPEYSTGVGWATRWLWVPKQ